MKTRHLTLLLLLFSIPVAAAFEPQLTSGLDIVIERIPEPLLVDGVQIVVHRASGAGVPELARRIEAQWRRHGSEIQSMQQGSWTLRSRFAGAASEVVQWRPVPAGHELFWSSLNAGANVLLAASSDLTLPASCQWGRSVSGRSRQDRFRQRSARCTLPAQELSLLLQRSLPSQGWQLLSASERGLVLKRRAEDGLISFSAPAGDRATWLTWLRVEHNP